MMPFETPFLPGVSNENYGESQHEGLYVEDVLKIVSETVAAARTTPDGFYYLEGREADVREILRTALLEQIGDEYKRIETNEDPTGPIWWEITLLNNATICVTEDASELRTAQ